MRIGKVSYSNTLPLFYSLKGFDIVEGHPADLVKKLREGCIDAGIVSSVEVFFNPENYLILPDISISSKGKVCSVLLLSRKPIEDIKSVRITPSSLTSRYLLEFIMKEVYEKVLPEVPEGEEDAVLVIGDSALKLREEYEFSYDLGGEWFNYTGLPFVFALFLVRREVPQEEARRIYTAVRASVKDFFADLGKGKVKLSDAFLNRYLFECIDYSLGEEHLRSLELFFSFMERETGRPAPDISALFLPL